MVYKAMGCKHMAPVLPTELPQAEAPKGCEAKKANTSTFEDNIARIKAVYGLPSTSAPSKAEVVEVLESPKKRCTEEVQDITSSQEEEVRVQQKHTSAQKDTDTNTHTQYTITIKRPDAQEDMWRPLPVEEGSAPVLLGG
jgi:cell envelope opacity-associated protein A